MNAEIFLSVLANSAACFGVLVSLSRLLRKRRAQKEFLELLAKESEASRLREVRHRVMEHGAINSAELEALIASLERVAAQLSDRHKALIEVGLRQRSLRGRARYAAKFLNDAGIGSGPLPIATP